MASQNNSNSNDIDSQLYGAIMHIDYVLSQVNIDKAEGLFREAKALLAQNADKKLVSWYYERYAHFYDLHGDMESSLSMYKKAAEVTTDPRQQSRCLCLMAEISHRLKQTDEAIKYCNMAIDSASESTGSEEFKITPLCIKGRIAFQANNYDSAIKYYNEAARIAEELHLPVELAATILNIAKLFDLIGKNEIAMNEMLRAERYAKEAHDYNLQCRVVIQRVNLLYKMGKDEIAKQVIQGMANENKD